MEEVPIQEKVICSECGKCFTLKKNLYQHMREIHGIEPRIQFKKNVPRPVDKCLEAFSVKKAICSVCGKNFTLKKNLYQHMREIHGIEPRFQFKKSILCPADKCLEVFSAKRVARNHLINVHKINIELEIHEFSSFEDFMIWKENFEKDTNSSYIRHHDTNTTESDCEVIHFQCQWSRNWQKDSESNLTSNRRANKLNTFCPSCIEVYVLEEKVNANLYKTHYGHELNLRHLSLSEARMVEIADEVKARSSELYIDECNHNNVLQEEIVEFSSSVLPSKNFDHTYVLEKDDLCIKWALIKIMLESNNLNPKVCLEINKKMNSIIHICKNKKENFEKQTNNVKTPQQLHIVSTRKRKVPSEILLQKTKFKKV